MNTTLNAKIQRLLEGAIADGRHRGLQAAAYKDGELIVDAWAGTLGPDDDRPVQADSLFSSYSTTKGVAALALHIVADRGLLDYDAPVAKYWPAFGAHYSRLCFGVRRCSAALVQNASLRHLACNKS